MPRTDVFGSPSGAPIASQRSPRSSLRKSRSALVAQRRSGALGSSATPSTPPSGGSPSPGSPWPAPDQEAPQSSLRESPRQPARYTRPPTAPRTIARAGAAPGGAGDLSQVAPSSERKIPEPVDASARRPSASKATANTAPTRTAGASKIGRASCRERV